MSDAKGSLFEKESRNFIENIIVEDLTSGKHAHTITRFPPEPNGYLHIGHAKSICLNFGMSASNSGAVCHLRFDDTNPEKEEEEYVQSIISDVRWLGFDWGEHLYYASDYFDQIYTFATELVEKGLAYVDLQSGEKIREQRGNLKSPGENGPHREQSVAENLELFCKMKDGGFQDGEAILRAKIDMAHPNMNMRDPVLYRVRHIAHQRTGDKWCIYPMYDFIHPLSDALEGISHSLCTLEFEDHRPLYDWAVDNTSVAAKPRQIEFARLNINYSIMSKRKLLQLVEEKHVMGWDDPRMPTVSGMRRRGYTSESIRNFCETIGIAKNDNIIDFGLLEFHVRESLNKTAKRVMGVLEPLKVTITNWEEERSMEIDAPFHPQDESFGSRTIKLEKTIYIEQSDFLKEPPSPRKWFRLGPDRSARLRYGAIIHCDEFIEDDQGNVIELKCHYVEDSFNGKTPEGMKKVKGIIHWVNASDAQEVEVKLYDRLFSVENPESDKEKSFLDFINPDSAKTLNALVEPEILKIPATEQIQFERMGYFVQDCKLSTSDKPVFNKIVGLRDSWAKVKG